MGNDLNPFAHLLTAAKVEPATRAQAVTRLAALRLGWNAESAGWLALGERVSRLHGGPDAPVPSAGSGAWPADGDEAVPSRSPSPSIRGRWASSSTSGPRSDSMTGPTGFSPPH